MMNSTEFLENKITNDETMTVDELLTYLENKITNDETMTVDELLTYIVNYIAYLNERLKTCEHMLYLDDESFENLKG